MAIFVQLTPGICLSVTSVWITCLPISVCFFQLFCLGRYQWSVHFVFLDNFQLLPESTDWNWVVLEVETCLWPNTHQFILLLWAAGYPKDITVSLKLMDSTGKGFWHWFWIWEPSSVYSVSFFRLFFHIYWVNFFVMEWKQKYFNP